MSKRRSTNEEQTLDRYFRFAVRDSSMRILARFHQYDHAAEFAVLSIVRAASANSLDRTHGVSIEWHDESGKIVKSSMSLTIEGDVAEAPGP